MDNSERKSLASLTADLNIHDHADWLVFTNRLDTAIGSGRARRVHRFRQIYAPSEEWFLDTMTGEVFVYLRPDDKVTPEWSRVNAFEDAPRRESDPKNVNATGLSAIPVGTMDNKEGEALEAFLAYLVKRERIQRVPDEMASEMSADRVSIVTFRDPSTDSLYEFARSTAGNYTWRRLQGLGAVGLSSKLQ